MISVTIIVKNGERRLGEVLQALQPFKEVVVVDTGSQDNSLKIASSFPNVVTLQKEFMGFGPTHNWASSSASHDWILSLDADEVPSPELIAEILALPLEKKNVYLLPFVNHYRGKKIDFCGWQKEFHPRLYNRLTTQFTSDLLHERVVTEGLGRVPLKGCVTHYSYESVSDFLVKMERYSTLFAEEWHKKRTSSPLKAFGHGLWTFLRAYILYGGIKGGYEGFLISSALSHTTFYKYLKLYERNKCA